MNHAELVSLAIISLMPTLILINPTARKKRYKTALQKLIKDKFRRAGESYEIVEPVNVDAWGECVRSAYEKGFDKLLVAGGDGTVHLSLQGLDYENVALGILPIGSGNDIYRAFGIPMNPEAALDNFFAGEERVDLGEVNGHFFLNTAGIGLDSWTIIVKEKSSGMMSGNYVFLFLKTIGMLKGLDCEIEIDGHAICRNAYWVIAANNRFIGGGMKIAPDADLQDGLFDVVIIGKTSKLDMVCRLPHIFKGTHINHPKAEVFRAEHVVIKCAEDIPCALDGELNGPTPLDIRMHHGKLRLRGKLMSGC